MGYKLIKKFKWTAAGDLLAYFFTYPGIKVAAARLEYKTSGRVAFLFCKKKEIAMPIEDS